MVVDATAELLEAGHLRPTAARVAERAGVSVRSVFGHFSDLNDLFAAVADARAGSIAELFPNDRYDGDLACRLDAFLSYRCALYESMAAVRRAATLHEPFSPVIAEQLQLARTLHGMDIERAFGPEVSQARARGEGNICDALCGISSFAFWDELRRNRGLGVEEARAVCHRTIFALLSDARTH